jgi:hypothetical protein
VLEPVPERNSGEVPSHVELMENELVDEQARQAALEGCIFDKALSASDFQNLARWDSGGILVGLPILFFQM